MKKTLIRSGVWETNSSSSHSVSIADETKQFVLDTLYPNDEGVIVIEGDEFGWDWFKHNDAATKASYAAIQFQYDDTTLDLIREIIMEQTGADDVTFNLDSGYIDHDSRGILSSSKEDLRNFIFNKNSWLFGGNDNSRTVSTFYDVPEYIDGEIKQPVYKYKVVVPIFNNTSVKFKEKPTNDELVNQLSDLLAECYLNNSNNTRVGWSHDIEYEFKFNSSLPADFDNNIIYFTKSARNEAMKLASLNNLSNEKIHYNQIHEMEMQLFQAENSPFVKKVNFEIIEL
jgi:hypothetical protein